MHGPINVKSPNNISKWQMRFNSAFKGLIYKGYLYKHAGPEAEGSNPTAGLTLLWARNPFRRNFNHWQVSQKEAGQNVRPERVNE
jgi:hypothetical protein